MISFIMLTEEDLTVLFKGFDDGFLQAPLKSPSKTLKRFIPNGFRPDKLKRSQKVKVFCDAIRAGENSISNYVSKEIETQFNRADITTVITSVKAGGLDVYAAICEISVKVWQAHIVLPSHIALLLSEIPCDNNSRKASQALANCYYDDTRKCGQDGYESGKNDAERHFEASRAEDQKKIEKLQRNVDEAKSKRDEAEDAAQAAEAKNEQLLLRIEELLHKLDVETENQSEIEKQKRVLHSRIKVLEESNSRLTSENGELVSKIEIRNKDLHILRVEVEKLTDKLTEAEKLAFSEDIIRRLCIEVLDELRASSPSREQIVEIAKRRFSSEITIEEAWNQITKDSSARIHKLCTDFEEKLFLRSHLDELEEAEDEVLIEYATLKALKSLLYNALEAKNAKSSIAEEYK